MPDEPASLAEAIRLATKHGASASRHAQRAKTLGDENAQLKSQLSKAQGDVDRLTKQVGQPDEKDQRIAELEGQLLTGRHKGEFAKAAKAAGVRDDAVDDLFTSLGYKAEGEPDAEKLKTLVEGARAAKGWAFAGERAGDGKDAPPPPKPVPGAGRGGASGGQDGTLITAEQRADPKFMLDPSRQDSIFQAAKEGRFR